MNIVLFKNITTEAVLKKLEDDSKEYSGLHVDMNNKKERKFVKDSAAVINDILKKVDRARIDIAKEHRDMIEIEAKSIVDRLETANKCFTSLIDAHKEAKKVIEDKRKAAEAKQLVKYESLKKLLATEDDFYTPYSADVLNNNLIDLQSLTIDESYGEYELAALKAQTKGTADLERSINEITKREALEAEQREAAKLAAEQEQKEREEQAALAAKQEAERIAAYNAEQEAIKAQEAIDKAEADKQAAIAATKLEAEKVKQAQVDADIAAKQAVIDAEEAERLSKWREEQARVDAEVKRVEAAEKVETDKIAAELKAEKDRQQAIVDEQQRVAAEQKQIEEDKAKREANTKHRKKVQGEILEFMVAGGIDAKKAKGFIFSMSKGDCPWTTINY